METLDYHVIANKIQAKYQRPCCMLTKTIDKESGRVSYQGSARGCDRVGVTDFKSICAGTGVCDYTVGHKGAFGLSITTHIPEADEVDEENLYQFITSTDKQLENMSSEPVYYVDYVWDQDAVPAAAILEIANMDSYWGKSMEEPLVAVNKIRVNKKNVKMMASNTLKITLPNGISMIKFRVPDEEYDKLYSENGYVEIDVIAKPAKNEWMGKVSPQLLIEAYQITGGCAYEF